MGLFLQDIRYSLRMLFRNLSFTIVAVLTLALGIGVNTTIFSGVSALLLRPLPYANAEQLVKIQPDGASKADLAALRERSSFDAIAAANTWGFTLAGDGPAEQIPAVRATADLFIVLGAAPLLGRTLLPADGLPGAEEVVVLSYGFWQRRFAGDPGIVGRTLQLSQGSGGGATRVVGVMPEDFAFPTATAELWAPNPVDPTVEDHNTGYLELFGRLAPGANPSIAENEVRTWMAAQCAESPGCDERAAEEAQRNLRVLPLRDALVGDIRSILLLLFGAVSFVLLIACANVANLLLTRAALRERELAVRTALGASRSRVARQLLTESLAIAAIGGAFGVLIAVWGSGVLRAVLPAQLVGAGEIYVDLRVLAFAAATILLVAVVAGLFPAFGVNRRNVHAALLDRSGANAQRARRRALGLLVVTEFALALIVAVGAGLMVKTFANLSAEDPGFASEGVLSVQVSPPSSYDASANRPFWRELLERVAALPGVQSAGAIHLLPFGGSNWLNSLNVEDGPPPSDSASPRIIDWRTITPDYVETLQIPSLRGRLFTEQDYAADERVSLINETAARTFFPDEDPIGQRIRTTFENDWVTIVGIVGDTKDQTLAGPTRPQMYTLHAPYIGAMTLMVRSSGDPLQLAGPIREAVRAIDDDVAVSNVQLLDQVIARSIAQPRLLTGLLFGFGTLALLLGAVGLYGVMAYGTVQRTREFGVRLALGARASEVLGLVARDAVRLAGIGVVVGLVGALALTRLLESQLYGVEPFDPLVFAGASLLLAAVAMAAALIPGMRAARTDPMRALRWE